MTNQLLQEAIPRFYADGGEEILRNEAVILDSATMKFSSKVSNMGDEIDVLIDPIVTGSAYTGGDYATHETPTRTTEKVKVNKGFQIPFRLKETDQVQGKDVIKLAKSLAKSGLTSFALQAEADAAALYTEAGIPLTPSAGDAYDIDEDTAYRVLAYAAAQADAHKWPQQGRIAYLDPYYCMYLGIEALKLGGANSSQDEYKNGKTGRKIAGFEIRMSNTLYNAGGIYRPLFTLDKQSMAYVLQKKINITHKTQVGSPDDFYEGHAYYGIKVYRADKLMTLPTTYPSLNPQ